jgi:holliday junction DNA helicase RuvB
MFSSQGYSFENIVGHSDIKLILNKAILSHNPVHVLLIGRPGCAKTMFLTEMMRRLKNSYFIVGSNSSKSGIITQLFIKRPKFLLIDELDKMSGNDQVSLLHLMETGLISETKVRKTRQLELVSGVFATANNREKIIKPLLSRFLVLEVPDYTFEQFMEIAVSRLTNEKVDKQVASAIAEKVWNELDSRDIRDVIKVGRLASNIQEVSCIVRMMKRQHNSNSESQRRTKNDLL